MAKTALCIASYADALSIMSVLIAHYDNIPFWIPAGTNKDDLE